MKERARERKTGYLFSMPAFLFMIAVIGFPVIYNWIISFQNMTSRTFNAGTVGFAGLSNYIEVLTDSDFQTAFFNTLVYTLACLVFQFSIGFILALLFNQKFRMARPLRGFLVISWIMPMTVVALMFKYMFSDSGIINYLLMNFHMIKEPVEWLTSTKMAMPTVVITNSWVGIPFNMLLLATGLSNIPSDVYESAMIDGAGGFKRFIYITLPLLKQSILAVLVLGFVYTFKVFDLVYVMTGGGPVNATEVLSTYSYRESFQYFDFGTGAASANVLFVCLFLVGLVYIKLMGKDEADE
ncbi:MAG: sugar ABC transporter permease [Clostridia bacterium]|nr:sugar ABC transporter permease [Clostridia bacterium]